MEKKPPIERDLLLTCQRCGRSFAWTVGDQRYYLKKRRPIPRHCRERRLENARLAASVDTQAGGLSAGSL